MVLNKIMKNLSRIYRLVTETKLIKVMFINLFSVFEFVFL